jgi:DNA-binding CsgD family transcriptional regulator
MRKSGRVRFGDLRQAFRLIHDCRDLGHNPGAWPAVMVEGLGRLVDADVVTAGELRPGLHGVPARIFHLADRGWSSPTARASWDQHYTIDQEFRQMPAFQRFAALPGSLVTRSREQLVDDGEWYGSEEFNEYHRSFEVDDILASRTMIGGPPALLGFNILRGLGRERFGARERRLVRIFHRELIRHVGTSLARTPAGPPPLLPPRLQETLNRLLEGDSEKQVARRMGLSTHTVHQYAKDLYRRLGVSTRAELMALCLRRDGRAGPGPTLPPSG